MGLNPIREARLREKVTQAELAALIGVAPSQMSRYEGGKRRIRLDEAQKIAEKLRISVAEILGTQETPAQREHGGILVTLPLPEGRAILEYPATLSPESREQLKEWLELIAKVTARE